MNKTFYRIIKTTYQGLFIFMILLSFEMYTFGEFKIAVLSFIFAVIMKMMWYRTISKYRGDN